jgi:hypothetical protein
MRYEVITQPSPDSEDDLLITCSEALLDKLGWKEGITLKSDLIQKAVIY